MSHPVPPPPPAPPSSAPPSSPPPGAPPTRGPERFAAPVPDAERPSWLKAIGAGLALVILLVGIPVGLWLLDGPPPFPTGLPSREDLTQPLSIDALLVVLLVVVWLAWLQFAVCTVVEVLSIVRGGGLPRPVPLSGPSQALARALVGAVLVGSTLLASQTAATAATVDAGPGSAAATASQVVGNVADAQDAMPGDRIRDSVDTMGQGGQADRADRDGSRMEHVPGVPAEMTDVIGHKVAVVNPPDDHYHDNLWDIAERHLGDGRRWKEIFDLNKGRDQPDGQQLVLGRLIQPGWVLIMPDDATGLQRVERAPDRAETGGGAEAPSVGSVGSVAWVGSDAVDGDAGSYDRVVDDAGSSNAGGFVGGGLVAAVLLGALLGERRRRRGLEPDPEEREAEVGLRVGADADRVARLDAALRGLSATCRAERLVLPQVYAATVADDHVELRIAPPAANAPAPWSVLDEGRRWRLDRDAAQHTGTGHAPYPGLVCLGRDDDGVDLLVDLESVGGIVSVTGSHTMAREVVSAIAVQLATVPWADAQVVRGYRLSTELGRIAGSPLRRVDDLGGLLDTWASMSPRRSAVDVLTGRLGRTPGVEPEYLVLGDVPDDDDLQGRLSAVGGAGSRGIGIVSATALPGARWRLRVDDAGRLSIPLLDMEVDAVRLPADRLELLGDLLMKARTDATIVTSGPSRADVPDLPRQGEDHDRQLAPASVGVLGPVEVRAGGALDASRLELATELAVFLALQQAPVHPSVVGASIWPRGVTAEVRDATIARTRDWLGVDADGNHLLRETPEGRLFLAESVAVDWHAFCTLVLRSREARPDDERDLLRRALRLVRGEILAGRPDGRYSWLPRTRLEHQGTSLVVDAAHRLAGLVLDDDPSGSAAACRAGLRLAPASQLLWRDLLVAESRNPDGPGTGAAVEEMLGVLQDLRSAPEAETDALVVELLPDERTAMGDSA